MNLPGDASEYLPVAPFLALVTEAVERHGSLTEVVRRVEGLGADVHPRIVQRRSMYRRLVIWQGGKSWTKNGLPCAWVSWAIADRIVVRLIGPQGWHERPELAALYESESAAA